MIYKRKGEETVKQCENWTCQTVWKDSWLERHQDENVCPCCRTEFEEGEIKILEPIKNKPKDKLYYSRMRLIKFEEELRVAQCRLVQLEGTSVKETWCESQDAYTGVSENALLIGKHVKDLKKIAVLRSRCVTLQNLIAENIGQIEKFKVIWV